MPVSKRKQRRAATKRRMRWPTTTEGWLRRWRRSLEAVRDKATDLWEDREIYKTWRETILSNPNLDKRNEFFHYIDRTYQSHILVALRTFDDTDFRSHSLYNLIEEIFDHNTILTKDWFVKRFRSEHQRVAQRQFDRDWGNGPCLGKRQIQADLRHLTVTCSKIRKTVNKYIAHTARRKSIRLPTHRDIDTALDDIYRLVSRYNALIFNAEWGEPVLLPWTQVFDSRWNS